VNSRGRQEIFHKNLSIYTYSSAHRISTITYTKAREAGSRGKGAAVESPRKKSLGGECLSSSTLFWGRCNGPSEKNSEIF